MEERLVNVKRAIMAHDESAEVAEPRKGALHTVHRRLCRRNARPSWRPCPDIFS